MNYFRSILVSCLGVGTAIFLLFQTSPSLAQQERCNAILSSGVFDSANVLDIKAKHEILNKAVCGKSNELSINWDDLDLKTTDYCDKTFNEIMTTDKYATETRKASQVITRAFSDHSQS